jgi:hypothetical protein
MIMNHLFLRSPFRSFASDVSRALRLIKGKGTEKELTTLFFYLSEGF